MGTVAPESTGIPGRRYIALRNIGLGHLCRLPRNAEWERNVEPIILQYDRQSRELIMQTSADRYGPAPVRVLQWTPLGDTIVTASVAR